jgi:DNA-binding transcriptional LysR family regulator
VQTELLISEPLVLALPSSHPSAGIRRPALALLQDENFISFASKRAQVLHGSIVRLCASAGFVPKIGQEIDTVHTALGLVRAGLGVAIVPASAMEIGTHPRRPSRVRR